jgi:hypothetical protein
MIDVDQDQGYDEYKETKAGLLWAKTKDY